MAWAGRKRTDYSPIFKIFVNIKTQVRAAVKTYLIIDWEMLETNPAARVPLFHEDNTVEHYMNDAELERLLAVLRTDENRPVCLIAMF